MADLARIHNLGTDLSIWTSGGSHAKPRFDWVFTDADGGLQTAYKIKVYSAAVAGSTLYDSGKVSSAASYHEVSTAFVFNTEYWWTVELWDDLDESSTESSRSAFKMLWGQAIYEYNVGASAGWQFASGTVPDLTYKAVLYRGATAAYGGGSQSAWVTSIGDIVGAGSTYTYLQVMVRLATTATTVQATFPDMRFEYTGSASVPDHWTRSGGTWTLDASNYRYGTRSLRCVVTDNSDAPTITPYRFAAGDDVPVLANTTYMLSGFVRIDPTNAFGAGSSLRLRIYAGGSDTIVRATGAEDQSYGDGATSDTAAFSEGWQRLVLLYTTQDAETLVRPKVEYVNGGAGASDVFWVDAIKMEEGTVATSWAPGWLSDAVTIDSYGVAIDASGGASFKLKHSNGTDQVDLDDIVDAVGSVGYSSPLTGTELLTTGEVISASNADDVVSWDTEVSDAAGMFSAGTPTRFTVVSTGWYSISVSGTFSSGGTSRRLRLRKNGSTDLSYGHDGTVGARRETTWIGRLTAADYVELVANQNEAGTITLDAQLGVIYHGP